MYNLAKYSDNYSKVSGTSQKYYGGEPAAAIVNSGSFKSKIRITWETPATGNWKSIEIAVLSKYFFK